MKNIINPIIEEQMNHIRDIESIKECLNVRLALLGQENAHKNEFEQNESDILRMKTEIELEKLKKRLNEKQNEFFDTFRIYVQELEELQVRS